jgi:hypothetical protein
VQATALPLCRSDIMDDDSMPLGSQSAMMWQVSEDRRIARMQLPPLRLAGTGGPLSIYFDMDAEAIDELLRKLSEVRAQMLPALKRN